VVQFKATVWPKIASESTYEAQKFQNVLGEHPPDPPAFRAASGLIKAGRGLGMRVSTRKGSVPTLCPGIGFVLATPLPAPPSLPLPPGSSAMQLNTWWDNLHACKYT